MKRIFKDRKTFIQYSYIYIMLSSAGMILPTFVGNDNFIIGLLLIEFCTILFTNPLRSLQQQYLTFIGILFASMLTVIIGSTLSLGTALNITSILLLVYITYKVDPFHYIQRFIKLVFYIALVSIIIFSITTAFGFNVFSPLYPYLYTTFSQEQVYGYGGFLYRFVPLHSYRNCGPFGEPGQYQCILTTALYFTLFHAKLFPPRERIWYTIVFFIALVTTLSTSGYIGMAIVIICFLLHPSAKTDKQMKRVFIGLLVGLTIFISATKLGNEFIATTVTNKIYVNGQLNLSNNTGNARTASIIGVLTIIYQHPMTLFGVGYDTLNNMGLGGCAGLLYQLLAIGILPFTILFGFCFYQISTHHKGVWDIIVRILLVLNMGLGQPHIMNIGLFTMMLYPYFITTNLKYTKAIHVRNS